MIQVRICNAESTPYKGIRTSAGPCASKAFAFNRVPWVNGNGQNAMASMTYFFLVGRCSANTSTQCWDLNSRMNRGSHSSLATPKSLQHRMSALLLHASVAVGMPEGSKYSCSPLAIATNLSSRELEEMLLTRAGRYSPSEAY